MKQQNDSLRERLLARLPRPENLASYREETASLLAKHERALSTEKWAASALSFCALAAMFFYTWIMKARPLDTGGQLSFLGGTIVFVLLVAIIGVRFPIYASQVATLKEIKQVQLQILELQAALLQRSGSQTEK
jgi:hypothetical protein